MWDTSETASIPIFDSLFAAQSFVLAAALVAFVLAALFAERRRSETALKLGNELLRDSNERLELALGAAELGTFSLDLDTGLIECDARAAHIHGHLSLPKTIKEGRRFVHPDDRVYIDARFAEAQSTGGASSAEYRVVHPPGHPHAGEVRWVAFEGSTVRGAQGKPGRLLGICRDITQRKRQRQALAERNVQLALAGKAALVGSYAYDPGTDMMQVSEGYAAIHGLPEGTAESSAQRVEISRALRGPCANRSAPAPSSSKSNAVNMTRSIALFVAVVRFGGSNHAVSFLTTVMGVLNG